MDEKQLEVSIESVKGLLIDGYNNYEKVFNAAKAIPVTGTVTFAGFNMYWRCMTNEN